MIQNFFEKAQQAWSADLSAELLVSDSTRFSVEEFFDLSKRFAGWIESQPSKENQLIALDLEPELYAVLSFSCYLLGMPSCKFRDDLQLLEKTGCTTVITTNPDAFTGDLDKLLIDQEALKSIAELEQTPDPVTVSGDMVCNIFFSSGTSGTPKAIPIRVAELETREQHVRKNRMRKSYISLLGLGTFGGFMTMYSQIINGEIFTAAKSPLVNARLIRDEGIKTVFLSPLQLQALLESSRESRVKLDLNEVQVTGDSLSPSILEKLSTISDARITTVYASTEAGLVSMNGQVDGDVSNSGRVSAEVEVQIVDENHAVLEEGKQGRVRIKSPGMATEYLNDAAATKSSFRGGWFYPGDEGYLRAGSLFLKGRSSEIVNIGGVKINPTEIDLRALEFPGISDAASFLVTSATGTLEPGLAFVSDNPPAPAELKDWFARKFGEGAPSAFFRVEGIPRNELGKPMRNHLAQKFQNRIDENA